MVKVKDDILHLRRDSVFRGGFFSHDVSSLLQYTTIRSARRDASFTTGRQDHDSAKDGK